MSKLRVLLIDLTPADESRIVDILRGGGFDPTIFPAAGEKAVEDILGRETPDIVVSRHSRKGFSGLPALRLIRSKAPSLRFLFVLGDDAVDAAVEAIKAGADDYLAERHLGRLSASVAEALAGREAGSAGRSGADPTNPGDDLCFREVAENMPEVFWLVDRESRRIVYANPAYEAIWGRPARNLRDNPGDWLEAVHPEDRPGIEETILGGREGARGEFRIIRPDGAVRWIRIHWIPIRREGRIGRVAGIAEDITERKRLRDDHERLLIREQAARDGAETANRAKDRFLANLSHELLAPLTPVLAAADLLKRSGSLTPETRNLPDMIRRNVELELRLINDLLDLSRISPDKQELNLQYIDIHTILGNVLKSFQADIGTKHLRLKIEPEAEGHHVRGDRGRLLRVFWNLIGNAVKYTPAGGNITISTRNPSTGKISIEVTDGGIDVEPGVLDRLFEVLEGSDRPMRFGELGLGLGISRTVIELHDGALKASRCPTGGSVFTVELPTVSPTDESARAAQRREPLTILLVENSEETLYTLSRLLRTYGHEVLTASSAEEALETARTNRVDLLISDIGLPDHSGWELMRQMRKITPIRGIALSGFGSPEDAQKSIESGFSAHMTKPVNVHKLEELIEEAVA